MKTESIPLANAAAALRLSWSRAWNLMLQGELVGEKMGNRWVVTTASVEGLKKKLLANTQ